MTRRFLFAGVLALALVSCGKGPVSDYGGEDGKKVADLIGELDDALQRPDRVAAVFAGGAAPKEAELKKYRLLTYSLVGRPTVSGTTATAMITVEKSSSGDKLGEKEWTFVKEGDAWKIKSAPLP